MKAKNIKWDIDENEIPPEEIETLQAYLPTEVEIPNDIGTDEISDWLSDTYGYCHYGFEIVKEQRTIRQMQKCICLNY